jgi:hypothetical protein
MENDLEFQIIEVIALMKSNIGSPKDWAKQLEKALKIEEMVIDV